MARIPPMSRLVDVMNSTAEKIFQQKKMRDSSSQVPLSLNRNNIDLITQICESYALRYA